MDFGIRLKLTAALITVAMVTGLSAGFFTIRHSYDALKRQKQQDELVIARNIAVQVDEVLGKAKQTIEALADHPAVRSMDPVRQREALTIVSKVTELIDGILVQDLAGNILVLDQAEPDTRRLLPESPYRQLVIPVKDLDGARFSEIYKSRTGEVAVAISAPIRRDGRLVGVLSGGILLKNHSMGGIEAIRIGKSGYAYIVDSKGNVIVHPQRERLLENLSANPPVQELLRKREGSIEFANKEGLKVLAAFAPIQETGWGVVVRQPTAESYAYADEILVILLGAFILSLLFAVGIGVFLAWKISNPVTALVLGARRVADGHLDTMIEVSSRDEIGTLAGTFNEMTRKLKSHMQATQEAHGRVLSAQRQLAQSEKMAAIGHLAAGLAHEINNPLNIISGFAEYLLEKSPPEDPRRSNIEEISRETGRCQRLVADVLRFAKPKEPERVPTDVNALVDETLALLQSRVKAGGITAEARLAGNLPRLQADPDQLKQVFLNVCLNACQAMTEGGRLEVETGRQDGHVRVVVRDTGSGIPPEHIQSIFNPFFTTKEDGTGLGLSLSYAMVEQHGGSMLVESRPGGGTDFTILLPLPEEEGDADA